MHYPGSADALSRDSLRLELLLRLRKGDDEPCFLRCSCCGGGGEAGVETGGVVSVDVELIVVAGVSRGGGVDGSGVAARSARSSRLCNASTWMCRSTISRSRSVSSLSRAKRLATRVVGSSGPAPATGAPAGNEAPLSAPSLLSPPLVRFGGSGGILRMKPGGGPRWFCGVLRFRSFASARSLPLKCIGRESTLMVDGQCVGAREPSMCEATGRSLSPATDRCGGTPSIYGGRAAAGGGAEQLHGLDAGALHEEGVSPG